AISRIGREVPSWRNAGNWCKLHALAVSIPRSPSVHASPTQASSSSANACSKAALIGWLLIQSQMVMVRMGSALLAARSQRLNPIGTLPPTLVNSTTTYVKKLMGQTSRLVGAVQVFAE